MKMLRNAVSCFIYCMTKSIEILIEFKVIDNLSWLIFKIAQ